MHLTSANFPFLFLSSLSDGSQVRNGASQERHQERRARRTHCAWDRRIRPKNTFNAAHDREHKLDESRLCGEKHLYKKTLSQVLSPKPVMWLFVDREEEGFLLTGQTYSLLSCSSNCLLYSALLIFRVVIMRCIHVMHCPTILFVYDNFIFCGIVYLIYMYLS